MLQEVTQKLAGIGICVLALTLLVIGSANAAQLCLEAEDFQVKSGWKVARGEEGYFSSMPHIWSGNRLWADESDAPAVAEKSVTVPASGTYNIWVRHESPYGFDTLFNLEIVQKGKRQVLPAIGRKDDVKRFQFGLGWRKQEAWRWHNTDWVYEKLTADLEKGPAKVIISKQRNGFPGAARVLDLIYFTTDLSLDPGDDGWWYRDRYVPPIISQFTKPVYFKLRVSKEAKGGAQVSLFHSFWLFGRFGGPGGTLYFTPGGFSKEKPAKSVLTPGFETAWLRLDLSKALPADTVLISDQPVELYISHNSDGRDAVRIQAGAGQKEIIVGTGNARFEDSMLSGRPAVALEDYLEGVTAGLEKYKPAGRRARKFGIVSAFPGWMNSTPAFTLGSFDIRRFAAAAGLTGQHYVCQSSVYGPEGEKFGFNRERGYLGIWNWHLTRECYEGDFAALEKNYRQAKEKLDKDGIGAMPQNLKLIEETGAKKFSELSSWPKMNQFFREYLKEKGVNPRDVLGRGELAGLIGKDPVTDEDLWKMVKIGRGTPEEAVENPVLYYHSWYFRLLSYAKVNAEATKIAEKVFPKGSYTNSGSFYPTVGSFSGLINSDDPFLLYKERGVTAYCSETSWGQGGTPGYLGPETESYGAAVARSLAKYYNAPLGSYIICDGNRGYTGDFVETASYALAAQGYSWLTYYSLGYPTINNSYAYPEIIKAIKRVSYTLGAVEDELLSSRVEPARVAIGWSLTTDIWDESQADPIDYGPENCIYPAERQHLYLLLRHMGIPVDVLGEEDLAGGYLKNYDVYFLTADHLSAGAAKALRDWVAGGGTLVSVAGGGLLDEYNRPMDTLSQVFGIKGSTLKKSTTALRAKLDLVHARPLDSISMASGKERITMPVLGYRQALVPDKGRVAATYESDGKPAIVVNEYGKGRGIIIGTLPGTAYLYGAFPLKPYGRGGDDLSRIIYPDYNKKMLPVMQALLDSAGVAGKIKSPAVSSNPRVEVNILKGADGVCRLSLVNYSEKPAKGVKLTVDTGRLPAKGARASFAKAQVEQGRGFITITLPVRKFELVTLVK